MIDVCPQCGSEEFETELLYVQDMVSCGGDIHESEAGREIRVGPMCCVDCDYKFEPKLTEKQKQIK